MFVSDNDRLFSFGCAPCAAAAALGAGAEQSSTWTIWDAAPPEIETGQSVPPQAGGGGGGGGSASGGDSGGGGVLLAVVAAAALLFWSSR